MKRVQLLLALFLFVQMSHIVHAVNPLPQSDGQAYVVQTGDWLSKLADKFYGDPQAWSTIVEATNAQAATVGLPPANGKTSFVEMWVKPQDLFRPSPDPEISDQEAGLEFPKSMYLTISEEYVNWFNDLNSQSYGESGYPWTRLGYTYDWGSPNSEVGLSEFVINPGATIEIYTLTKTEDYCR